MKISGLGLLTLLLLACVACSPEGGGPSRVVGEASKPGSSLAYEHTVRIRLAANLIGERVALLRKACQDEQFGQCSILKAEVSDATEASGEIVVRAAAKAIEPLVKAAAGDGEIQLSHLKAVDLAAAVADTARERETWLRQRESLLAIQARPDLGAEDLLKIVQALSEIEVKLAGSERAAAEQKLRIETNLLTIYFGSRNRQNDDPVTVAEWMATAWGSFRQACGMVLLFAAYLIPFLAFALILLPVLRRVWTWIDSKNEAPARAFRAKESEVVKSPKGEAWHSNDS